MNKREEFRKTYKEKHPNNKSVAVVSISSDSEKNSSDLANDFKAILVRNFNF